MDKERGQVTMLIPSPNSVIVGLGHYKVVNVSPKAL